MIDRNEPAFPRNYNADGHNGMTLRDHFAGQALAGLNASPLTGGTQASPEQLASWSYAQADAMLAARKEPTNV